MKRIFFGSLLAYCLALATSHAETPGRVVVVRDPGAVQMLDVDSARAEAMVRRGICALTGKPTEAAAWATLVASNDVVAIKVSTEAAPLLESHPAIVEALATGLRAAGVAATNIVVWDRNADKLAAAGFKSNERYQVRSVVGGDGWDADHYYESPIVGRLIWGDLLYRNDGEDMSTRSHLPRLLTRTVTKLINVPVLHDHEGCGLAGCLYNLTVSAVDNERRFYVLGQRGDPMISAIYLLPEIKDKVILHVLDGLVGGYAGAPAFKVRFSWPHASLYFGHDPVAIDTLALEQIEKQRIPARIAPVNDRASHIATAAKNGLGVAERSQIQVEEVAP